MGDEWECVVGGGAAGLSAALVLGRARRRTVVIDADEQSNRASPVIGGLLGYDQRPPAELYAAGRRELSSYPSVEYRRGQVRRGRRCDSGFVLDLDDGEPIRARRVLLATGMLYCPPNSRTGRAVGDVGVPVPVLSRLGDARQAAGRAGRRRRGRARGADVAGMERRRRGADGRAFRPVTRRGQLAAVGDVAIDDRRIVELIGHDGELTEIAFADGTRMQRDGLLVEAPLRQRSPLAEQLGATCTPGPVAADAIGVDDIHRTDAGGVFAAGDVCTKQPHLAGAVAAGSQAAMIIVQSLLADEFGLPYPPT